MKKGEKANKEGRVKKKREGCRNRKSLVLSRIDAKGR